MAVRGEEGFFHVPAVTTRAIASTVGAGDAMFAAFCHVYAKTGNPHEALAKATVFASYKIGEVGGAKGFLDEEALERLWNEKWPELHGLSRR
jgi:acarbose 7IV-phosphotransferase